MTDILLDENGDLRIENGDLVVGNSDLQNQQLLLMLPKGSLKEYPDATVGLMNFLEAEDSASLLREIKMRFSADGMDVKQLYFDSAGKLKIEAPYK